MSGGSYDYICFKISELKDTISKQSTDPRRAAFARLMALVGEAMHDIEWVDSCDYGAGDEHKAIDEVFAFLKASPEIITKAHAYDKLKNQLKEFLT